VKVENRYNEFVSDIEKMINKNVIQDNGGNMESEVCDENAT